MALSRRALRQQRRVAAYSVEPAPTLTPDEDMAEGAALTCAPAIQELQSPTAAAAEMVHDEQQQQQQQQQEEDQGQVQFLDPNLIKRGDYLLMHESAICKVMEINKSKPGKHGSAKISIVGIDVFTSKKHEELYAGSRKAEVPEVKKFDLELTSAVHTADGLQIALCHKGGRPHRTAFTLDDDEDPLVQRIDTLLARGAGVLVQLLRTMGRERVMAAREKPAVRH